MVVYICNPCVVVHAFQIELTDDKIKRAYDRGWDVGNCACDPDLGSELLSYINSF